MYTKFQFSANDEDKENDQDNENYQTIKVKLTTQQISTWSKSTIEKKSWQLDD